MKVGTSGNSGDRAFDAIAMALSLPLRTRPSTGSTLANSICTLLPITPTEAGLIYCLEPVFTAALALFLPAMLSGWGGFDYPNETATFALLAGGGLITVANVLIQLRPPSPLASGKV